MPAGDTESPYPPKGDDYIQEFAYGISTAYAADQKGHICFFIDRMAAAAKK